MTAPAAGHPTGHARRAVRPPGGRKRSGPLGARWGAAATRRGLVHLLEPATAWAVLGLIGVGGYVLALSRSMDTATYDVWGAYIVGPVLLAIAVPLIHRVGRATGEDRRIVNIMILGLVLKLVMSIVRYVVAFDVYDGVADASGYAGNGAYLAEYFRRGEFDVTVRGQLPGTGFVQVLTGIAFVFTGTTTLGGFLLFGWIGYWGQMLFYRAARIGLPDGDHLRYAQLVFLMPTMMFWSASIGKEAWMLFVLGLCTYGTARLLAGDRGGVVPLVLGLAGAAMVRPHMSALVWASLLIAFLRKRSADTTTGPVIKAAVLVLAVSAGMVLVRQAEDYFGVEDGVTQATEVLDEAERRTTQGGSGFEPTRVDSPGDLPTAFINVVFRPFPHEAHNLQALLASLEGAVLLGLFALAAVRLRALPILAWRRPFVLYSVTYTVMFVVAFSSFGNFGILARQRVQLLPMLFVVLCIPQLRGTAVAGSETDPTRMTGQRPSNATAAT